MSEYKGIKGFQVQTRTEDPTPFAQALANNPYAGSWASGSALNTGRTQFGGSGASYNSALGFGGDNGSTQVNNTESYNGSSWTEVNDLNTARSGTTGFGTQTAAFAVAGFGSSTLQATVESWNGSSWTETTDINTARRKLSSAGVTTSGIVYGGQPDDGGGQALSESWNGSAWTETSDLNTARGYGGRLGVSNTSALMGGGDSRPPSNSGTIHAQTETWNGSAWTEVNDLNTARGGLGGSGTLTDGIVYGGQTPPNLTNTEAWDGTSWTEVNDLATARARLAETSQSGTSALGFGGEIPPGGVTTATEEWQFSGLPPSTPAAAYADAIIGDFYYNSTTGQFKTVNDGGAPIGTWASGGALNTAKQENFGSGAGTQTAAAVAGGYTTTNSTNHEQYDGTSWTETTEINTGRYGSWADGTQPAFWMAGGYSTTVVNNTETWNGSSWTEVNNLNTSRAYGGGTTGRSLTAGLVVSGYTTTNVNNVEQWDGTNWTEVSEVNTARRKAGGFGTSTSAFAMGAAPDGSAPATNLVESWDGSSWTETTEMNTGRGAVGAAGTTTDGLIYGSEQTPRQITESWNGTTWTEVADMGANQGNAAGSGGTATSAWIAGGTNGSTGVTNTEEWTAADFQIKSVTTS